MSTVYYYCPQFRLLQPVPPNVTNFGYQMDSNCSRPNSDQYDEEAQRRTPRLRFVSVRASFETKRKTKNIALILEDAVTTQSASFSGPKLIVIATTSWRCWR